MFFGGRVVLLLAAFSMFGCVDTTIPPSTADDLGVAYSPRGHIGNTTTQDATDFFANHAQYGSVVAFHMNWRDNPTISGEIPTLALTAQLAGDSFQLIPAVGFGWTIDGVPDLTSQISPTDNTWNNPETRVDFLDMVTSYVEEKQPPYLFLGNETNLYYLEATPDEWADWVSMYAEAYAAIKAASPDTVVYTVFQLERLKGLGAKNGWSDPPQWDILADFANNTDGLGFTSYPYFEYDTPDQIPTDYYTEILSYWSGPVMFTEIGWLDANSGPYTGSNDAQIEFVNTFVDRASSLEIDYTVWLFLHDLDTAPQAFDGIGLKTNDGTDKPVADTWRALVESHRK